jgi:hypothetical protein
MQLSVFNDPGTRRVSRINLPFAAYRESMGLIEIRSRGYVRGYYLIVPTDTVHLNRQVDWNAQGFQFPRRLNRRRSSKTLAIQYDAMRRSLGIAQQPVCIAIKRFTYQLQSK